MNNPLLILASASPRRRELLTLAGFEFEIDAPGIDEIESGKTPDSVATSNARLKAAHITARRPGCLVVAADTVVALDGILYAKPVDLDDALRMLRALSGRTHEVITGVCLAIDNRLHVFHESTRVTFRPAREIDFDAYLRRVHTLDKAGAYSAQEDHGALIAAIDGCRNNVIGLPLDRLLAELASFAPAFLPRQG